MTASKETLRSLARPNGRDWIDIGQKLDPAMFAPNVPEPTRETGPVGWYIVVANPRCEMRVQSGLIDKGFAVYVPQYKLERIIPRKGIRKIFDRVLFARYLFVSAPYGSWPRITSTDGVQGLVRDCGLSGKPMTVSDRAIRILMDSQNAGDFDVWLSREGETIPRRQAMKMARPFGPGSRVKVNSGPFASFFATVVEALAGNQAKILVEIFGRATPLEIDLAALRAA